jgi:hypothetical protein
MTFEEASMIPRRLIVALLCCELDTCFLDDLDINTVVQGSCCHLKNNKKSRVVKKSAFLCTEYYLFAAFAYSWKRAYFVIHCHEITNLYYDKLAGLQAKIYRKALVYATILPPPV